MIPAAQLLALVRAVSEMEMEMARLKKRLAAYESNSRNSSKPPSSDRHNPNRPKTDQASADGNERGKGKAKRKRKPGGGRKATSAAH